MATTTWKQVVLDTADAYREANGTTDKIPVGELADKVRAGVGTPYTGDNPLTLGQDGYTFPAKTLLKEGLQIINGVSGEDLTETAANQTSAVNALLTMVKRKVVQDKGEGEFVWKKLTAEGGDFVDYVISSDSEAYPDGAVHTDGYWYELVEGGGLTPEMFGCTKMAIDEFTVSSWTKSSAYSIPHSLGEKPTRVIIQALEPEKIPGYPDNVSNICIILLASSTGSLSGAYGCRLYRSTSDSNINMMCPGWVSGELSYITNTTVNPNASDYWYPGIKYRMITMVQKGEKHGNNQRNIRR